jgi:release factor glutamine methyltransferase
VLLSQLLALCRRETARVPGADHSEAEILVSGVTGVPRNRLFLSGELDAGDAWQRLAPLLERRAAGEPLQYVLGRWDFFGREFLLSRDTRALAVLRRRGPGRTLALDVGTGSGAIAVSLAAEEQGVRVVATDVSAGALRIARDNALRHGVASRVAFLRCDAYSALKCGGRFDVVVSNPPYVAEEEWPRLPPAVRDHEPPGALLAGPDGLSVLRRLAAGGEGLIAPGGELWCEIGASQGPAAASLFSGALEFLGIFRDLAGRDRYAGWKKPEQERR